MHMRRIAPLLADLFVRHGLTVDSSEDGALLTVHGANGPFLVSGDLTGTPVDNATLAPLAAACTDANSAGLFIHDGPVTTAALRVAGSRIHLWSADAVAHLLGLTELAHALDQPLPRLPIPAPVPTPVVQPVVKPTPQVVAEPDPAEEIVELQDDVQDEVEPVATTADDADVDEDLSLDDLLAEGDETLAETLAVPSAFGVDHGDEPEPLLIDLPLSALADVEELTEDPPVSEPFIELADDTPVLHLEEADGSIAEVEPADAKSTEAPDVIHLDDLPKPVAAPAVDVLQQEEFEVPAVEDLMPAAFRDAAATAAEEAEDNGAEPLALPAAFQANERETVRAPDGSQGLLPPRITLDEAKALVADRLFSIEEAELILQPVHLFDYQVDLLKPGKLTAAPVTGRLQVNGTDRRVTATDPSKCDSRLPHRVFHDDELTVMDKVLRVSPDRAHQLATAWATAQHAKTVQVTTDRSDDSYALTEAKDVAPTSTQVHLTSLGLWHRPFWRLWGDNGHADIDAVEGHVLEEEIKTPNPDFMLLE